MNETYFQQIVKLLENSQHGLSGIFTWNYNQDFCFFEDAEEEFSITVMDRGYLMGNNSHLKTLPGLAEAFDDLGNANREQIKVIEGLLNSASEGKNWIPSKTDKQLEFEMKIDSLL